MEITVYVVGESRDAAADGDGPLFLDFKDANEYANGSDLNIYKATLYVDRFEMYEVESADD